VLWSERFRKRGYSAFSYSLKAVGIGTLYLSLWGAFQIYHLIPAAAAFLAMATVNRRNHRAGTESGRGIVGELCVDWRLLISGAAFHGAESRTVLFSYVALLDLAILVLTIFKPWRRLLWASFVGTIILYLGWYSDYYTMDQRAPHGCVRGNVCSHFRSHPAVG